MVFVDAHAVESELIRKLQLVQVTVVERMAQLGIVERSWDKPPRRSYAIEKNPPADKPKALNESNKLA